MKKINKEKDQICKHQRIKVIDRGYSYGEWIEKQCLVCYDIWIEEGPDSRGICHAYGRDA